MTKTKTKNILFNAGMVLALLAGTKTQTRRVCKNTPLNVSEYTWISKHNGGPCFTSPYGKIGDYIWVKETFKYSDWSDDGYPIIEYRADKVNRLIDTGISEEWANKITTIWANLSSTSNYIIDGFARDRVWRPSIFMPMWASRITLEITDIRIERLQALTASDAIKEGVGMPSPSEMMDLKRFSGTSEYRYPL